MTKEELYLSIASPNCVSINRVSIGNCLDEFFESNVCIPKGENRHRDADILHEIAENPDKHLQMKHESNTCDWDTFDLYTNYFFRIKPSEPIYEWQCYYVDSVSKNIVVPRRIKTEDFYQDWEIPDHWVKVEETKRERK